MRRVRKQSGGCFPADWLYLFDGIDRTAKFSAAQRVATADRKTAWEFLQHMLGTVPCQVHIGTPLVRETMARGMQLAEEPRNRNTICSRSMRFDLICEANGIEHLLTRPNHPWSHEDQKTIRGIVFLNGSQVERIPLTVCKQTVVGQRSRTIKDATVKRYHYDSHDQLRTHLADFLAAHNFARRLKTRGDLTPYEYICKIWTSEPDRFILDPIHQMPRINRPGATSPGCV